MLHFSVVSFRVFRQFVLPCALLPPHPRLSGLARGFEGNYSALSAHSDSHLSRLTSVFGRSCIYKHRGSETQRIMPSVTRHLKKMNFYVHRALLLINIIRYARKEKKKKKKKEREEKPRRQSSSKPSHASTTVTTQNIAVIKVTGDALASRDTLRMPLGAC